MRFLALSLKTCNKKEIKIYLPGISQSLPIESLKDLWYMWIMKKLFVLILLTVLLITSLSGCGLYNLNNFVLPDDAEFLALVQELDTPQKICNYMEDNFTYEFHIYTLDPYTLWQTKKGDCLDFATFAVFIANCHGYETYQIRISFNSLLKHRIAVYVEDEGLSFSDCQCHSYYLSKTYFDNFKEIVNYDCEYNIGKEWSKYIVYNFDMQVIEQVTK